MSTASLIKAYLASLPGPKRAELEALHRRMLGLWPVCKLWFLDGRDATGKVVTNPNIGYGEETLHYADGSSKAFYKIGLSANSAGISVYVMGLADKDLLPRTYGKRLGKASITGYRIKFKRLADIHLDVLDEVFRMGAERRENEAQRPGGVRRRRTQAGKVDPTAVYLAGLPPDQRKALETLRDQICAAVPGTEEHFAYGLPAFRYRGHPLVYMGAAKAHCALYGTVPAEFRETLTGFIVSKGTIRFTPEKPIPAALVRKIVQAKAADIDRRWPEKSGGGQTRAKKTALRKLVIGQ